MFAAVLFLADLVFPDAFPFIDELILGISTLLLASWRNTKDERREQADLDAKTVDGEVR